MTPAEFVESCAKEREYLLEACLNPLSGSAVAQQVAALALTGEQQEIVKRIVGGALTDAFYTILLGLDGAAPIGGRQMQYKLYDEGGTELTGDLEGLAWEHFHGGR